MSTYLDLTMAGPNGTSPSALTPAVGSAMTYVSGFNMQFYYYGVWCKSAAGVVDELRGSDTIPTADAASKLTIQYKGAVTGTYYAFVNARRVDANNFLHARMSATSIDFYEVVAGVPALLGSVAHTAVLDEVYELTVNPVGDHASVLLNTVEVIAPVETAVVAAGHGSFGDYGASQRADENVPRGFAVFQFVIDDAVVGGGGSDPALKMVAQPTSVNSGMPISPDVVVRATTDGSTTDTAFTGSITAALIGSGGVLYGTVTVAAVAGVAAFSNLVPGGSGTFTLRFSASSYDDVDSSTFAVLSGSGSTILFGGQMHRQITQNESSANGRRMLLRLRLANGDPWLGDVTGVKALMTQSGTLVSGDETESPDDIVHIGGDLYYVDPGATYTNIAPKNFITARVEPADGHLGDTSTAEIIPTDSYNAAIVQLDLIKAIIRAANGLDGFKFERAEGSSLLRVTIPGEGTFDVPAEYVTAGKTLNVLGDD